jgi:hypothetical protein
VPTALGPKGEARGVSILVQFIFRLSFGMALGMALTSPRQVTSGYYRNHLYVLLGLAVLATMVALGGNDRLTLAPPLSAAILSYVGSVLWLYGKPRAGIAALLLISAVCLWGAWQATAWPPSGSTLETTLSALDPVSGGLVLGFTMAAMFLGHWYLNSPGMAIGPLERLIVLLGAAVCLRALVEAAVLAVELRTTMLAGDQILFLALRWLSGIFGAFALAVMAYRTLKIPNTQSATGILYVCVIATFLGELVSLLMTVQLAHVS